MFSYLLDIADDIIEASTVIPIVETTYDEIEDISEVTTAQVITEIPVNKSPGI